MKPIIFSTPMVQAILAGHKMQTRRVIKPQPINTPDGAYIDPYNGDYKAFTVWTNDNRMCLSCGGNFEGTAHWEARYLPGDVLWVRETWCELYDLDGNDQWIEGTEKYYYAADNPKFKYSYFLRDDGTQKDYPAWKPSIHMPKEAARIFLKVADVRVERLQSITLEDMGMEGFERSCDFPVYWDRLNAKRGYGWNENPWVWVISFERLPGRPEEATDLCGNADCPYHADKPCEAADGCFGYMNGEEAKHD